MSVLLLVLGLAFNIAAAQETPPTQRYSIDQFLKTTSYRGASFSHDSQKILVSSDQTGVFNAYCINVADGSIQQLTDSSTESNFAIGFFPQDDRFLVTHDQGGNELNHVYVVDLQGQMTDLTPGERLKAQFGGWSQDDQYFYIGTNERDPRYFDLYEYNSKDLSRTMIFKNEKGFLPGDISPDRQLIALSLVDTRDNSNVYIFDRRDESMRCLTEHTGDVNFSPATFTPDGRQLLMTTDEGEEFRYLISHDLESGKRDVIAQPSWDVGGASFSKHGKYFTYSSNEDARTVIRMFEYDGMKPVELPEIAGASLSSLSISRDEQHLAMYATSGKMPSDLFYHNLADHQTKQLTRSLNEEIDPDDLVNGQIVRFKSFDGTPIPGVLYMPKGAAPAAKVPAIVWVHGGPGGQSRIGYRPLIQYLVNHGYALYAINNRGSSGYGKTFQQMDDQKHGEGDLDDCVYSKKMLAETGRIDPDRIGILGGSYGGYMVCAALAFRPEEFDVGVDIFGVTNWHRTVQNIPPWWEAQRKSLEKEMGDFDDLDYFKKISPLFHAENIQRPLMVLQGANDPRVLKVESDEMVAAVQKNGVPVDYLVFDDEGHGFRKKKNQKRGYEAILKFLDKHLKGSAK